MTQIKLGASHVRVRLFKSVASSAVALSALTGGVMLSGGEAKAYGCNFGPNGANVNCLLNQWLDTNDPSGSSPSPTDKQLWLGNTPDANGFFQLPSDGIGDIEWTWQQAPGLYQGKLWVVDVDFNPAYPTHNVPVVYPSTSIFTYALKITSADVFDMAGLSTLPTPLVPTNYTTVKEIFAATLDTSGAPVCGSKIQTLNNPPVPDQDSILGAKVICVKDTLTVNAGSVDNYQNSYSQVPGPLPVLGASLVLGSVRKLRNLTSRLKVHSMG